MTRPNPEQQERKCQVTGFRDYQSVIQAATRRGDRTRRVPLDPEQVRALFSRMVSQSWPAAEIGTDRPAGPAAGR
jgi:hypothetical protein